MLEFRQQLRFARAKGELQPDVDDHELAWVLVSSFTGAQLFSQASTGRADLPQRIASLWRYLLPAVAADGIRGGLRLSLPPSEPKPESESESKPEPEAKPEPRSKSASGKRA